ncbi:MAG: hypothetical protein ABID61_05320 [Candidatus Micrarchaeota archaeon]
MKGHRAMHTDIIPERTNHDRQPNWLVRRRLQSALATVTKGREFTRTSTIPLLEGLRFDLAGCEQGRLEFQGISRRAFVYRNGDHTLIIRGVELVSSGLRYDIYSGPVLTRDVVKGYVDVGQLDTTFLPQACSGSIHAVELAVYDSWSKTWLAPTWYSLGRNPDVIPSSELTPDGIDARNARMVTIRLEQPQKLIEPRAERTTVTNRDAVQMLLSSQLKFIITTDIQSITTNPFLLTISDIDSTIGHRLNGNIVVVTYSYSGSSITDHLQIFNLPVDKMEPIGDDYKAYVRTKALVEMGMVNPHTTSHFAVVTILDETNQPVENFICGVR